VHSDAFKNSEWGSESSSSIEDDWRAFKLPIGGTIGDLINSTPPELVSKVMLEEKLYTTWYHRRTVLMGDGMLLSNGPPNSLLIFAPSSPTSLCFSIAVQFSMPQGM
jgi:hypothetical protein